MSDNTTNPYAAPAAEIETHDMAGEIQFCEPRKIRAGEGNGIIVDAWGIYKQAPVLWTIMSLLLTAILIAVSLIPILGTLFSPLLYIPLMAGLFIGAEQILKGGSLSFGHLFSGFKTKGMRLIGFSIVYTILYLLAFLLPFAMIGGTDLLTAIATQSDDPAIFFEGMLQKMIISGLTALALSILVMMTYWFAVPLMVFQDKGIFAAMSASFKGCLKNVWPMFIYGLLLFIWMIVSMIPIGLGLLVLIPVLTLSLYTGYRRIYTE